MPVHRFRLRSDSEAVHRGAGGRLVSAIFNLTGAPLSMLLKKRDAFRRFLFCHPCYENFNNPNPFYTSLFLDSGSLQLQIRLSSSKHRHHVCYASHRSSWVFSATTANVPLEVMLTGQIISELE